MISCRLISETVAATYGITVLDLQSRRMDNRIVLPRHMSWALARKLTRRSYPEIGRLMGGFDHTTIMNGVRKIEAKIASDTEVADGYLGIAAAIRALGEASDRSDRPAMRFDDIDPEIVADAVLDAPLRSAIPSLEEVRAICMGIRHYAAEVQEHEKTIALLQQERDGLRRQLEDTSGVSEHAAAVAAAAGTVVAAHRGFLQSQMTINERPARKTLQAALTKLQNVFERT